MRKAEFKKQVEKTTDKHGDLILSVYKAHQYRWQDGGDIEEEDEAYFFTQEEAKDYLETLSLTVGFEPKIERIDFEYVDFNTEIEFGFIGEIEDFLPRNIDFETVFYGDLFEGDDYWTIEDGEVVWSCWDEQSEELFRENPYQEYFETEEDAINSLN